MCAFYHLWTIDKGKRKVSDSLCTTLQVFRKELPKEFDALPRETPSKSWLPQDQETAQCNLLKGRRIFGQKLTNKSKVHWNEDVLLILRRHSLCKDWFKSIALGLANKYREVKNAIFTFMDSYVRAKTGVFGLSYMRPRYQGKSSIRYKEADQRFWDSSFIRTQRVKLVFGKLSMRNKELN